MSLSLDPDYVRYPIHLLTGCSLVFGLIASVTFKKKTEQAVALHPVASGQTQPKSSMSGSWDCNCKKLKKRAEKAVKEVETDIRELLEVSLVSRV